MPGASAAYYFEGEMHFANFGTTSADNPEPVTEHTLFGIGSTSKTLTGTAMMALVEQGKVDLDDRVIDHLQDLPVLDEQARDEVTVGMLLDHTPGWVGDAEAETGWGEDALARGVAELLAKAPQQCRPGTLLSYNNTAVNVAGHLVATLHGTSFEDAVRDLVLAPLRMKDTHYLVWDIANRSHAVGHVMSSGTSKAVPNWLTSRCMAPAGGAFSSARDLMTYARFHLTGEVVDAQRPISEDSRLLMQQMRSTCRSGVDGAGVSWLLGRRGELRLIEHGGNLSNLMVSTFSLVPDANLAIAVNGNSAAGTAVGTVIRDHLIEQVAGPQDVATKPMDPQPSLQEYVGWYAAGQWDIEVDQIDGQLDFGMRLTDVTGIDDELREVFESKRTRATFIGPDLVTSAVAPAAPVGDFIRDADGNIEFFRVGLRLAKRR